MAPRLVVFSVLSSNFTSSPLSRAGLPSPPTQQIASKQEIKMQPLMIALEHQDARLAVSALFI